MTSQEAITILKREYLGDSEFMELAKQMGANALKKQIPKKPTIKKSCKVNAFTLRCPNCEAVLQSDSPHCRYCGQALDWSDTE